MDTRCIFKLISAILILVQLNLVYCCTNSLECTSSSRWYCCSSGYCCSASEYTSSISTNVTSYLTIGIGAIVGIVIGCIVLIVSCIVGCVFCCRRRNVNPGMVVTTNAAQYPAGMQQQYSNPAMGQAYPGQMPPTVAVGQMPPPGAAADGSVLQYTKEGGPPPPY